MDKIFALIFSALSALTLASCGTSQDISEDTAIPQITETVSESQIQEESNMNQIKITVGDKNFSAVLYDNDAANAFAEMLPLTLNMSELNGNEKYFYLSEDLPTSSERPDKINSGDIMLYGSSCAVLFYDTFSTSYSYTRLGYIEDTAGLAAALGKGDAEVKFEKYPDNFK